MFERRNQDILSKHYGKLIERDSDEEEDLITLKRADHDLTEGDESLQLIKAQNLSNRKLKLGFAKRKMILNAPSTKRLVFDDDGQVHQADNVTLAEEWVKEKGGIHGGGRWRDREVVEGIWTAIEEGMKLRGWGTK